ncbi:hypothetical protein J7L67_07195, partial [bacterium]|nr:hypothetical protein [bacterium]
MKIFWSGVFCFFLSAFFVSNSQASIILSLNFDEVTMAGQPLYPENSVYGHISGLKNLFGSSVFIDGGTIVNIAGNKMVKLQGQSPYIATEFGIRLNTKNVMLENISFHFFFDSVETTQNSLTIPSILTVELFLIGSNDDLIDTKYLLYFTKDGINADGMDISPDPASYPNPYKDNFSLSNFAFYTAHLGTLADYIFDNSDEICLVPSVLYPDSADSYDTIVYFDDFTFT